MPKYEKIPCPSCKKNMVSLLTSILYLSQNVSPYYLETTENLSIFLKHFNKRHCDVCLSRVFPFSHQGKYHPKKVYESIKQLKGSLSCHI
jgi:hypothetical protein